VDQSQGQNSDQDCGQNEIQTHEYNHEQNEQQNAMTEETWDIWVGRRCPHCGLLHDCSGNVSENQQWHENEDLAVGQLSSTGPENPGHSTT
jgi:hypothetical protein